MKRQLLPLGCVLLVALLALAACGNEGTTVSTSPSATIAGEAPLPAPTVSGTIAFTKAVEAEVRYDIYVVRSDGTGLKRAGAESYPAWSPDGQRIGLLRGICGPRFRLGRVDHECRRLREDEADPGRRPGRLAELVARRQANRLLQAAGAVRLRRRGDERGR